MAKTPRLTEVFQIREGLWSRLRDTDIDDRLVGKSPQDILKMDVSPEYLEKTAQRAQKGGDNKTAANLQQAAQILRSREQQASKPATQAVAQPPAQNQRGDLKEPNNMGQRGDLNDPDAHWGHSSQGNLYRKSDDDGNIKNAF